MPKAPEGYQPLLKRGSRGSLWLADDHLLVIENTRFLLSLRETYRRLDFSNIRALLHAKSQRGAWLVVLLLCILCTGIVILTLSGFDSRPAQVTAATLTLPSLLCLVAHFLKGPTTSLTIQTTVHPWRIKAVTRHSHVAKVLSVLEPLCRKAQQHVLASSTPTTPTSPLTPPHPPLTNVNVSLPVPGAHPLAFPAWLCLLAFAAMMAGELVWNSVAATLVMLGFATASFTLLMIAFTRSGGSLATGGRGVFIFALAMLGVSLVAGYGAAIAGMMQSSLQGDDSLTGSEIIMLRAIARFPEGSPQALSVTALALAALTGTSAVAGLAAAAHRNKLQRSTSMESPTNASP